MSDKKTLTFYLQSPFRERASAGEVNFVNKVVSAFASCGYAARFRDNSDLEVVQSANRPGFSMFHMEEPFHSRALTMRLAYFYPFWRIEKTSKRWKWAAAKARFNSAEINRDKAAEFVERTRRRLYGADHGHPASDRGYVYLPLQGRLLKKRSFQTESPIEMIKATLRADPDREIRATLHPKEQYSEAENQALAALGQRHSRLSVVSDDMQSLVRNCSYVVTQNSSIAMHGFFFHKPAILFARIDFHHIAINVHKLGVEGAFAKLNDAPPEFEKYLFWFLQKRSINAGRDGVEQQILETVRSHGWRL